MGLYHLYPVKLSKGSSHFAQMTAFTRKASLRKGDQDWKISSTRLQDILWLRMKGASTCSFKSPILIVIMSLEKSETPETQKNLCSVITHTHFSFLKQKIMYDFQTIWSAKIFLISKLVKKRKRTHCIVRKV